MFRHSKEDWYVDEIEEGLFIVRDGSNNQIGDFFNSEQEARDFIDNYDPMWDSGYGDFLYDSWKEGGYE